MKMPCVRWLNSPGDAISNWLPVDPELATVFVPTVGSPSRNCAKDCARSFVPAELLARVKKPLKW